MNKLSSDNTDNESDDFNLKFPRNKRNFSRGSIHATTRPGFVERLSTQHPIPSLAVFIINHRILTQSPGVSERRGQGRGISQI